jgi:hypothetical protein
VTARGPQYDPGMVGHLANEGQFVMTTRVTMWLTNHGYGACTVVRELLAAVPTNGHWLGSCTLANATTADEYALSSGG